MNHESCHAWFCPSRLYTQEGEEPAAGKKIADNTSQKPCICVSEMKLAVAEDTILAVEIHTAPSCTRPWS